MAVEKVLINGAGIAGLALGIALGQRGVAVHIVEVKSDNAVQGIGISVPANAVRVLHSLGVLPEFLEAGLIFDSYRLFDVDGVQRVEVPMPRERPDGLPSYVGVPRPAYAEILAAAAVRTGAKLSFATTISEVVDESDGIKVTFSNGDVEKYDVLVGADGIRSQTRRRIFGVDSQPLYSGVGAWRVEVPRPSGVTYMATFQGLGSRAGLIPISEESMYLFFVDAHAKSQPEYVYPRQDQLQEIFRERLTEYTGIVGEIRDAITADTAVVYTPFERVLLPLPWHVGRSVVMGDAAHAMSANVSQGASSALEDALVLAEELTSSKTLEESLICFGERRYPRTKFVQDMSHRMLMNEVSTDPTVLAGRTAEMAEVPRKFRDLDRFLSQAL